MLSSKLVGRCNSDSRLPEHSISLAFRADRFVSASTFNEEILRSELGVTILAYMLYLSCTCNAKGKEVFQYGKFQLRSMAG